MVTKYRYYSILNNKILYFISHAAIITSIFSSYTIINYSTIGIGFATLSIILNIKKLTLKVPELFSLLFFALYCILVFSETMTYYHIFQNIRYWFGVILFVIFFITLNNTKYISIVFFRFMCFSLLLEAILINLFLDSSVLHGSSNEIHKYYANGLYERPIGFTGNPGTSGVFIIVLLYYISKYFDNKPKIIDIMLLIFTVLSLVSTTALLILLVFLLLHLFDLKSKRQIINRLTFYCLLVFAPITVMLLKVDVNYIQKYSIDYIVDVMSGKFITLSNITFSILGSQTNVHHPTTSGDFGLMILFSTMGIFGFCSLFLLLLSFDRNKGKYGYVLLLFLIGSIHYPSMFQPAGQVLTAMILVLGQKLSYVSSDKFNVKKDYIPIEKKHVNS